jgi:hypothetical protein
MNRPEDETRALARRARELFDASVESVDAGTAARLRRARQAAIESIAPRPAVRWSLWVPAGALASTALLAVLLWRGPEAGAPPTARTAANDASLEAFELLVDDDLALVEDDPAFYAWLATTGFETNGGTG